MTGLVAYRYARDVGRVFTHPSSVNFGVGKYETGWVIYSERVQTEKVQQPAFKYASSSII
jgi:hypothetical protein